MLYLLEPASILYNHMVSSDIGTTLTIGASSAVVIYHSYSVIQEIVSALDIANNVKIKNRLKDIYNMVFAFALWLSFSFTLFTVTNTIRPGAIHYIVSILDPQGLAPNAYGIQTLYKIMGSESSFLRSAFSIGRGLFGRMDAFDYMVAGVLALGAVAYLFPYFGIGGSAKESRKNIGLDGSPLASTSGNTTLGELSSGTQVNSLKKSTPVTQSLVKATALSTPALPASASTPVECPQLDFSYSADDEAPTPPSRSSKARRTDRTKYALRKRALHRGSIKKLKPSKPSTPVVEDEVPALITDEIPTSPALATTSIAIPIPPIFTIPSSPSLPKPAAVEEIQNADVPVASTSKSVDIPASPPREMPKPPAASMPIMALEPLPTYDSACSVVSMAMTEVYGGIIPIPSYQDLAEVVPAELARTPSRILTRVDSLDEEEREDVEYESDILAAGGLAPERPRMPSLPSYEDALAAMAAEEADKEDGQVMDNVEVIEEEEEMGDERSVPVVPVILLDGDRVTISEVFKESSAPEVEPSMVAGPSSPQRVRFDESIAQDLVTPSHSGFLHVDFDASFKPPEASTPQRPQPTKNRKPVRPALVDFATSFKPPQASIPQPPQPKQKWKPTWPAPKPAYKPTSVPIHIAAKSLAPFTPLGPIRKPKSNKGKEKEYRDPPTLRMEFSASGRWSMPGWYRKEVSMVYEPEPEFWIPDDLPDLPPVPPQPGDDSYDDFMAGI